MNPTLSEFKQYIFNCYWYKILYYTENKKIVILECVTLWYANTIKT